MPIMSVMSLSLCCGYFLSASSLAWPTLGRCEKHRKPKSQWQSWCSFPATSFLPGHGIYSDKWEHFSLSQASLMSPSQGSLACYVNLWLFLLTCNDSNSVVIKTEDWLVDDYLQMQMHQPWNTKIIPLPCMGAGVWRVAASKKVLDKLEEHPSWHHHWQMQTLSHSFPSAWPWVNKCQVGSLMSDKTFKMFLFIRTFKKCLADVLSWF